MLIRVRTAEVPAITRALPPVLLPSLPGNLEPQVMRPAGMLKPKPDLAGPGSAPCQAIL